MDNGVIKDVQFLEVNYVRNIIRIITLAVVAVLGLHIASLVCFADCPHLPFAVDITPESFRFLASGEKLKPSNYLPLFEE